MALVDSRLGPGTLSLGSTDYGTQISNVRLTPTNDTEDGTPTLGIPTPPPLVTLTWSLSGTAIQDWENVDGFVEYCRTNANTVVAFDWTPNTDKGVSFSGTCQVVAVEIGGDVNSQNTTDFEFAVVGDITRTNPATARTTTTK
jgi:hypothetical protein